MIEEIKKLSLAALGAASTTYEKVSDIIDELVVKGRISVEEGRQISEELKRDLMIKAESAKTKANEKIDEIKPVTRQELNDIINNLNLATKQDIDNLKSKITQIEEKLNNMQK